VTDQILETCPAKLSEDQLDRLDFLHFELKHSLTAGAHSDLLQTRVLKALRLSLASKPQTLKEEAWRYFESIGLGVSVLSFFLFVSICPSRTDSVFFFSFFIYLQVDNLAKAGEEPIPFFGLKKAVRAWMLHPELSRTMVVTSDSATLPYIPFIVDHKDDLQLPPGFPRTTRGHMSDGIEWFEPLRRTVNSWYPAFVTSKG